MAIENIKNINQINYDKMEEGFIKTDFGNMYFKHNESKDQHIKIIMIHGLGGTTKSFAKLIDNLPNDIDIYLIDLLGHGNSDKPKIKYSIDIQVTALSQFIEKTKYSNFYLLGHSYGGFVALKYLLNFGTEKIKALILEDSAGLKEYYDLVTKDKKFINNRLNDPFHSKSSSKFIMRNILSNLKNEGLTDLSYVDKPVLIIWGKKDAVIKPYFANKFKSKLKNSKLKIIENAEHIPHYSHFNQVSTILLKFIKYNKK